MTRDAITEKILAFLDEEFEIENPGLDDNLREQHEFDSIDAIVLLEYIEELIESPLTQEEKKSAMDIKSISQIVDYIEGLLKTRS
ncbi:MAG TPA: phosphopantetheine-binding protein [Spirochaetota bacterium]|nr:phosphopantetheine-binding protein [Spirochaetota bacterium]HPI88351.1 phosphopantetheine-binding protein [Spirochaetota bacterium]HPR46791.1 phosphopantetheine-binding protein [Spirochaetota bacterium]